MDLNFISSSPKNGILESAAPDLPSQVFSPVSIYGQYRKMDCLIKIPFSICTQKLGLAIGYLLIDQLLFLQVPAPFAF